jgi:predicted RNase H-like HicB family nuclease
VELTMVFKKVAEGYIGFIEDLPGANTQGRTLAETRRNLRQAIRRVLDTNRQLAEEILQGEDVIREPLSLASL